MKQIVLDIDHCLIFTSYSEIPELELISRNGYHYLYHRPHLKTFLNWLIKKKYDLIFYTSAKIEYAEWIIESFELDKKYPLFARYYTKKKTTDYGEVYLKSLDSINLTQKEKVTVLDDRPDLWDERGVEFLHIDPWHGEVDDTALFRIITTDIKNNQQRLSNPLTQKKNINEK